MSIDLIIVTILGFLVGCGLGYSSKQRAYREKIERKYKIELQNVTFEGKRVADSVKEQYESLAARHAEWIAATLNSRFSLGSTMTRFYAKIDLYGNAEVIRSYTGLSSGRGVTLKYMEHVLVCDVAQGMEEEIALIYH